MKGILSFLSGAVMGGLVGATLALLFAPETGDDLRLQMRNRVEHVKHEAQLAAEARRAELEHQLAELRAPRKPEQY